MYPPTLLLRLRLLDLLLLRLLHLVLLLLLLLLGLSVRLRRGRSLVCQPQKIRDRRERALGSVVHRRRGRGSVAVVRILLGSIVLYESSRHVARCVCVCERERERRESEERLGVLAVAVV